MPLTPTPTTTSATTATYPPMTASAAPAGTLVASTLADGAPSKLPIKGGGPADGAANLQLQQALQSLVQALTSITELLRSRPETAVAGATGGGHAGMGAMPTTMPPTGPPTKMAHTGDAGCDMPPAKG